MLAGLKNGDTVMELAVKRKTLTCFQAGFFILQEVMA